MKRNSHVELIDPREKLSPELGGTGYVGPREPTPPSDLRADAVAAFEQFPQLNMTVWKVLRSSVNWKRPAVNGRRLSIGGRVVPCEVIGSVSNWWFVSVDASKAARILEDQ